MELAGSMNWAGFRTPGRLFLGVRSIPRALEATDWGGGVIIVVSTWLATISRSEVIAWFTQEILYLDD